MVTNPWFSMVFWPVVTVVFYWGAKAIARRHTRWWTSPLIIAPVALLLLASLMHAHYRDYIQGSHWLMAMLGPVTVAFALPIYEQRALIRRHWPILVVGIAVGSLTAMASGWGFATVLSLSPELRQSLLPRSITTPFAMEVSRDFGGIPDLTAVFVIITGVLGAALGEVILKVLPLRSSLARGALFGMGAHGAGVARAHRIGAEEGSIAGLVMVLAGLFNVAAATALTVYLHG